MKADCQTTSPTLDRSSDGRLLLSSSPVPRQSLYCLYLPCSRSGLGCVGFCRGLHWFVDPALYQHKMRGLCSKVKLGLQRQLK